MREYIIQKNEAGQRLDKFLIKYLSEAPGSFIYKMLRKKNITLNKKKATGSEKLRIDDLVQLFFAEETFEKFTSKVVSLPKVSPTHVNVVYEDEHLLILNKPAGILSQKAEAADVSLNEEMIAYLLEKHEITEQSLATFRPSICNRLDRNTSGIVLAGKSLEGTQYLSEIIRERTLQKYYKCMVHGVLAEPQHLNGYLKKNEASNKVTIYKEKKEGAVKIETNYTPLGIYNGNTLLEVELLTGKSHQIRAHLSSIGHPILGDYKYGQKKGKVDEQGMKHQALFAYKVIFPKTIGTFSYLSGKTVTIENPDYFKKLLEES